MANGSGISWCHNTDNYVRGCSRCAPECEACWAIDMAWRLERFGQSAYAGLTLLQPLGNGQSRKDWSGKVSVHPEVLAEVRRRTRPRSGEPYRNFWCSMGDLFHPDVTLEQSELGLRCWLETDWQIHMLLTKRTGRMAAFFNGAGYNHQNERPLPPHIWPMTTIGTQKRVDELAHLGDIPAAVRAVSVEPLLERVDFTPYLRRTAPDGRPYVDLLIIGGESAACGRKARPMELEWVLDLFNQAREYGVAIWFKQVGEALARKLGLKSRHGSDLSELPELLRRQELPDNPEVCAIPGYQPRPTEVL